MFGQFYNDNLTCDCQFCSVPSQHISLISQGLLCYNFFIIITLQSVSVLEGDSVTLKTGLTDIQRDAVIQWRFEHQKSPVAEINRTAGIFNTYDGADGRFRDRLQLDHQTGSLIIMNMRNTHSGLYEADIIRTSSKHTIHKTFNVTVSDSGLTQVDVAGFVFLCVIVLMVVVFYIYIHRKISELKRQRDTVKSVSVKEGDSVTLQINVTEIQTDDEIEWKFGTDRNLIAKINGKTIKIFDGPDGIFRDRLKLDNQTGSLIITDTRTTDSGLYEVDISRSSSEDTHRFMSVIEGDSVTLKINVNEIQTGDEIEWKFGTNRNLIAKINGKTSKIFDGPDGRFRNRLKLDNQTGSLIITDTRTTDSGLYESITAHSFIFYRFVKEGDSVTLQMNVNEIQTDDKIEWKFRTERNLIAKINGKTSKIHDGPDGRFRDRLKLDHQTGSLTITNTRTQIKHRFNVTVYCDYSEANQRLANDLNEFYCRFETPHTHSDHLSTQPLTPPGIPLSPLLHFKSVDDG
uniref:Immunoglobulin domain-containing protein n=1 Tax=Cyprinus carpio TaxID=7962 RepID=A0A8C2JKE6_CYPCA